MTRNLLPIIEDIEAGDGRTKKLSLSSQLPAESGVDGPRMSFDLACYSIWHTQVCVAERGKYRHMLAFKGNMTSSRAVSHCSV